MSTDPAEAAATTWSTVSVVIEDGIGWVSLNRPDKRNAMSPTLNREMIAVLQELEGDDRGAGGRAHRHRRCVVGGHGSQGVFPRG